MKTLKVLLVEDNPEYSSLVLQWLSGDPDRPEFSLIWTDSLAAALSRLEAGGIDVVLMDLGLPDSDGLKTFTALQEVGESLPIIVLSAGDSQALALQTIQRGAEDYLVKSSCTAELLIRTLHHAVARHQLVRARSAEPVSQGRIVGLVGGAGGVGTTTTACVLAAELRCQTEQETLLIDLDFNLGLVTLAMGIDPRYTVQDLCEKADRIDASLWEGVVTHRAGQPDVLVSSKNIATRDFDGRRLKRIIGYAASQYRWVVIDLGRLNRNTRELLPLFTDVLLVTAQTISALHQCKQAIGSIQEMAIEAGRLGLILNRTTEGEQLAQNELERLFGVPIAAALPPSGEELHEAYLNRRLPDSGSAFRQGLSGLARRMGGLPDLVPKRTLLSLSSFAGRFRRKGDAIPGAVAS